MNETRIFLLIYFIRFSKIETSIVVNFDIYFFSFKVRTDRSLPFYDGDDNPNVDILRDILLTYSFYNFDLGYCQVINSQAVSFLDYLHQ